MNIFKSLINKSIIFLKEDKLKNDFVENQMVAINIHRILIASSIAIIVHILHVILFKYKYIPTTYIELIWQKGIIVIHGINTIIMIVVMILTFILNGRKDSTLFGKIVEYIFIIDVLVVGIALVTVDQYVTTNITPFLVICTVIGILVLKRPAIAICIYTSGYLVFYKTIGFYQANASILLSNRVNGITCISIGIGISLIIWYSFRTNILQNLKIEEQKMELEKLAFFDTLTGLYNRRKWMSILNEDMDKINTYGREDSIILLDIDYFKKINDKFGHPIGDKILQQVANILKKELRVTDKVARWGGEEFIILLPETALSKAISIAEDLRDVIENELIILGDFLINVTASFGVSCLDRKQGFSKSYNRVDEALYLAKQKGRNRVECINFHSYI